MTQFELIKPFVKSEDDLIDILIYIENHNYVAACSLLRAITGYNFMQAAKSLKAIAQEEMGEEIMPFLDKD